MLDSTTPVTLLRKVEHNFFVLFLESSNTFDSSIMVWNEIWFTFFHFDLILFTPTVTERRFPPIDNMNCPPLTMFSQSILRFNNADATCSAFFSPSDSLISMILLTALLLQQS